MKRKREDVARERYEQLLDCIKNNIVELSNRLIVKIKKEDKLDSEQMLGLYEATKSRNVSHKIRRSLITHLLHPVLQKLPFNKRHPLWITVGAGDAATLELLLKKYAFILNVKFDCSDNDSTLILHALDSLKCSPTDCVDVVDLLLEHGADVNTADSKGRNLLHKMCFEQYWCPELMDLLFERGISVDYVDENCDTPLHYAIRSGHERMVLRLLDNGADLNRKTLVHSTSPLIEAARHNEELIVNLLLERGADVNQSDAQGNTALHAVCELANNVNMIKLLFQFGANIAATNAENRTPFSYIALQNFKNAMAKLFVAQFARIEFRKCVDIVAEVANLSDLRLVNRIPQFKKFYDDCFDELRRLDGLMVCDSVSMFHAVFVSSRVQLALFMKNQALIKLFTISSLKKSFPLNIFAIKSSIEKAKAVRNSMYEIDKRVYLTLRDIFPDVVIGKIINFLYYEELAEN